MSASAITSTATIVALFDNAEAAGLAAGAVKARVPGAVVHRVDPAGAQAAMIEATWLPPETIDPYLASLGEGRTLVAVEADQSEAAAIDGILREYRPAEAMIHGKPAEGALPPSIQSTAAQTGRPHGHRDPSA